MHFTHFRIKPRHTHASQSKNNERKPVGQRERQWEVCFGEHNILPTFTTHVYLLASAFRLRRLVQPLDCDAILRLPTSCAVQKINTLYWLETRSQQTSSCLVSSRYKILIAYFFTQYYVKKIYIRLESVNIFLRHRNHPIRHQEECTIRTSRGEGGWRPTMLRQSLYRRAPVDVFSEYNFWYEFNFKHLTILIVLATVNEE